jgi:4-alpha-glucanotransferase
MSIDEGLRWPVASEERINIPANPRHYWRYRMHMNIEDLLKTDKFNNRLRTLIGYSGRL